MDRLLPDHLLTPPREFTLMPFWFWNDDLNKPEILRQIADFDAHGVFGFVIHPRVGLPRNLGWMSDALLDFMGIAIEEASRLDMKVMLYDEGMYPSGSSSGQVVAHDPALAARCLALVESGELIPADANVIAHVKRSNGHLATVIDRQANSCIRGLHYLDESGATEDEPAAGDILNPRTAALVLRLIHDRFYERFGSHFGKTIIGVFTDEPSPLGRLREKNVVAGTAGILPIVSDLLGYDFVPHLAQLWESTPESAQFRKDYDWAIHRRLETTWYEPLSRWCEAHGVALCGHPDRGDEIGVQQWFHIPGQDLVWRWVLPDHPSALEGPQSTQAKSTSSAMIHLGRRRNSNEFCGAYGHATTFEEFQWLANWSFARGVNLLIPHAFYYSVRGPRRDERPPQVGGVGCSWWDRFHSFADHCRRLSWLNTDCTHCCDIAILSPSDACPWQAAKVLFQHQRDFNYLETKLLEEAAQVDEEGIGIAGMFYRILVVEKELRLSEAVEKKIAPLRNQGRVITFSGIQPAEEFTRALDTIRPPDVIPGAPAPSLRVRHVIKADRHYYFFFNEAGEAIKVDATVSAQGIFTWIDIESGDASNAKEPLRIDLPGFGCALLQVD